MTEQEIQNSVRLELSKLGFITFRINVGKFKLADGRWFDCGPPPGASDVWAIKKGRIYFLEIKTKTGRATKEQLNFIKQMQKNGCVAGVVRSVQDAIELVSK